MKKRIILFTFVLFFISCTAKRPQVIIQTSHKNITVAVEIAENEEERTKGLMFRTSLAAQEGMLFIFPEEQHVSFWMKNTLIALDMIFIDQEKKIVFIEKNVPPCKDDPCPVYSSSQKVMYILEVNGGFTEKNNVKEGDRMGINF